MFRKKELKFHYKGYFFLAKGMHRKPRDSLTPKDIEWKKSRKRAREEYDLLKKHQSDLSF
ncbi:hypothetical protein LCGC14_0175410 [marine sediment metagenome]|uniref:Uncharacterized protein n=1 Tax=marine sediment metagenome TaxID=412755 RepID=A0A0F9V7H3_9ZZZZ